MSSLSPKPLHLVAEPARAPYIKINASATQLIPQLRDGWEHRELLYFLVWRDLKIRYRQTLLGVAWVIVQPVLMTIVFTIFFSWLGRFQSDGLPYPLFAYAGLLPWTFFANATSAGTSSLLANSSIITKVYFPRLLIPIATVGVRLVDLLVAAFVMFGLMAYYGVGLHVSVLLLPIFIAESTLLAIAVAAWLAILNIRYRDIATLLPVLIQVWMFTSPIIYPTSTIPVRWRRLYSLNPLVGIIEGFRSAFFGLPVDWTATLISLGVTLFLLICVVRTFNRWQERLIDHL